MQPGLAPLTECPCARAVATVGEWWSILILCDALQGLTRFDEFERSRGIAPNMLARRLKHLVESGLFERRLYHERPKRYEYILTEKGRDFFPVVAALIGYANRHLAPEGASLQLAERGSEEPIIPITVAAATLQPITVDSVTVIAGPQASTGMHERLAFVAAREAATRTKPS
ncbi:MAG: helix-turn-helix transcriptional regulator [Bosea sp.]|uniref:winged helix-turn-helix transcriptional regulator n=1 Tax=Bosea sp. (in: a-proteobacteria) TaxID=1871050 RepID=UPI001ACDB3EB|nr:helix-turn-helix domain-containing protein [Bosea sp. (in: a-proteobacteria)]MBN9469413.1 helix-turn-helix transcriptional regulator [Bosea sp. (in: a-proteobacteria)]